MDGQVVDSVKLKFYELRKYKIDGFKDEIDNRPGSLATNLIAVANRHRYVVVACNDMTVRAVNIDSLFNYEWSKNVINETVKLENFDLVCRLTFNSSLVSISNHGYGSILLCAGQTSQYNSPVIQLFNLDSSTPTQAFATITQPDMSSVRIVEISWHPVFYDSIVALCTNDGRLMVLAIDEARSKANFVYSSSHYGALSCCWSPKGKHLVVGRQDGKIFRLEYEVNKSEFKFKEVDKSIQMFTSYSRLKADHQVVKVRWISKGILLVVHARPVADQRETLYSIVPVRAGRPFYCWPNLISEGSSQGEYQAHIINLTNAVVCGTSASPEAAFLGRDDKLDSSQDPSEWRAQYIERKTKQGSNIRGMTIAYGIGLVDSPVLLYFTCSGNIVPGYIKNKDFSFTIPNIRRHRECPLDFESITPIVHDTNISDIITSDDESESSDSSESSGSDSEQEESDNENDESSDDEQSSGDHFQDLGNDPVMEDDSSSDDDCIHRRFTGVDVNTADFKTMWDRLNEDERKDFKKLVDSGDIYKFVPKNE